MDFLKGAKDFTRNPLGIIALFISLIYGFASLLLDSSAEKLTVAERWPLILFIVFFPIFVLITFYKLVTNHHGKLYAPGDFKDDKSFLRTLSPEEQEEKLDKEVKESLGEQENEIASPAVTKKEVNFAQVSSDSEERQKTRSEHRDEIKLIEESVIRHYEKELGVSAKPNIGIGDTDAKFDALLKSSSENFTFLEVKVFRSPHTPMMMLDRLLYQAVVADKFFHSNFKLIVAVVYLFDESELPRAERMWQQKIERCPVDIEVNFMSKSDALNA